MHDAPQSGHRGKRRFYLILGLLSIVSGLAVMSLAGYVLFLKGVPGGPGVFVRRNEPLPAPVVLGSQQGSTGYTEAYRLVIERLGVDAPVAAFGLDESAEPEIPFEANLIAWYNFSAVPGTGGNAVFAGHKTWNGNAVFARLEELETGDQVKLRLADGAELVYEVTEEGLVDPADPSALSWMSATESDAITLITCGGTRRETDTILGAEYDRRAVVRGALVGAVPAAPPPGS